jgi:hypothetical protein
MPTIIIDSKSGNIHLEIFGRRIEGLMITSFNYQTNSRQVSRIGDYHSYLEQMGYPTITASLDLSPLPVECR